MCLACDEPRSQTMGACEVRSACEGAQLGCRQRYTLKRLTVKHKENTILSTRFPSVNYVSFELFRFVPENVTVTGKTVGPTVEICKSRMYEKFRLQFRTMCARDIALYRMSFLLVMVSRHRLCKSRRIPFLSKPACRCAPRFLKTFRGFIYYFGCVLTVVLFI